MVAAGIVFLLSAVVTMGRVTFLSEWFPGGGDEPQALAVAALQSLLGGGLLLGSEGVRKFVLWLSALGAVASAAAGAMVRVDLPLAALASLGFLASAAAFLLLVGQAPSRFRMWSCVVVVLLSWVGSLLLETGIVRLPDTRTRALIAEWALPERTYEDAGRGVRVSLPDAWVMLAPGNPILAPNESARVVFAHQEADSLATLVIEDVPEGVASLDHYIDLVMRARSKVIPSYEEHGRSNGKHGLFETRVADIGWTEDGDDHEGRIVAWQDGWRYFALSGAFVETRAQAGRTQFDELLNAVALESVLSREIARASARIGEACPHLSGDAIETLLERARTPDLAPPLAFRRAYQYASAGLGGLNGEEGRELGELMTSAFSTLREQDRSVLGNYLDRIRRDREPKEGEDERMCAMMRGAYERIPNASKDRLQELFSRAVVVGSIY